MALFKFCVNGVIGPEVNKGWGGCDRCNITTYSFQYGYIITLVGLIYFSRCCSCKSVTTFQAGRAQNGLSLSVVVKKL